MEKNERPVSPNPSQRPQPQGEGSQDQPKEGDIRKVVRSTDKEAFDDEYEVEQEGAMGQEESSTEEENNTDGTQRGDTFNSRS